MSYPLYKPYTNGRISLAVQIPCFPCVSSRSRSQLKVNYHTIKCKTLCPVRFVSPTLMERFSYSLMSNIKQTNIRHYAMSAL